MVDMLGMVMAEPKPETEPRLMVDMWAKVMSRWTNTYGGVMGESFGMFGSVALRSENDIWVAAILTPHPTQSPRNLDCCRRRGSGEDLEVNFFFAPRIALLFFATGVPPSVTTNLPHFLWYVLMTPIFIPELKIYGQWMSGGQRRLSKVANPSNHLSVVGNFVGALLGASMGLKEGPIFFFAVGMAHYIVLFVTLYQRLPTNGTLPKELHPVFFLFVAASMAWAKINGSFEYGSRLAYFIAMFLYFSLAVRVNFFRGFKFSLAWGWEILEEI